MRIAVVSAGTGTSTRALADRLAAAARRELGAVDPSVDVVELRDLAHPLMDALLTGFTTGPLRDALDLVEHADGLVVVTPIHSASFSALLKAFVDVLPRDALAGVPVLIGATGGSERHTLALEHAVRPLFSALHALVVPTAVHATPSDLGREGGGLAGRIDRAAAELAGLAAHRRCADADRRGAPQPVAELLAG
jgi:FMN reductase